MSWVPCNSCNLTEHKCFYECNVHWSGIPVQLRGWCKQLWINHGTNLWGRIKTVCNFRGGGDSCPNEKQINLDIFVILTYRNFVMRTVQITVGNTNSKKQWLTIQIGIEFAVVALSHSLEVILPRTNPYWPYTFITWHTCSIQSITLKTYVYQFIPKLV